MKTETEFEACIDNQLRKYIARAKRDGTTGMSLENLKQVIRAPSHVEGSPKGGNAIWQYNQIFNEICTRKGIREFIIH